METLFSIKKPVNIRATFVLSSVKIVSSVDRTLFQFAISSTLEPKILNCTMIILLNFLSIQDSNYVQLVLITTREAF